MIIREVINVELLDRLGLKLSLILEDLKVKPIRVL